MSQTRKVPTWAASPLRQILNFAKESTEIVDLCGSAFRGATKMPQLVEVLGDSEEDLAHFKRMADAAQRHLDSDLSMLLAHLLVGLWGVLEASIEDLVVTILCNDPHARGHSALTKVKLPAVHLMTLDEETRWRLVVDEVQRSRGSEQRFGIGAFESLLETVGIGGAVDSDVSATLFELQQIRHVVVHRFGIADANLVLRCPALGLITGQQVSIGSKRFGDFIAAVLTYAAVVGQRLASKYPAT